MAIIPSPYTAETIYGASGDTTGKTDTPRIQAAISSGGQLAPGTFYVSAPLTVDSLQILQGSGAGTIIKPGTGFSGAVMVTLKTPASTYQATIRGLSVYANTGSAAGISLDNTGFTTGGGQPDPLHTVEDVQVFAAAGDGFFFGTNVRSGRFTNLAQYGAAGNGFNITGSDNFFASCVSGASGLHGFYLNSGTNNLMVNSKAFYAGYNGSVFDSVHSGFYLNATEWFTLVNCSAQQNALHGYDLESCSYVTVTGCEADTNGAGSASGAGINTNGNTACSIGLNTGGNNAGLSPGSQAYGVQVAGTQNNTVFLFNTIQGSTNNFNYVSGGGYTLLDTQQGVDLSQITTKLGSVTTSLDLTTAGTGLKVAEGSNAKQGTATLTAGSKVVSNTAVTANSRIFVTSNADGGTPGWLRVSARTAGTSFTITSSSGTDTSTVAYEIFEPG